MSSAQLPRADQAEGFDREGSPRSKPLPPAAERALAEAAARRRPTNATATVNEVNSPAGPDPVRYGDWERKGIASDF